MASLFVYGLEGIGVTLHACIWHGIHPWVYDEFSQYIIIPHQINWMASLCDPLLVLRCSYRYGIPIF